MFELKDSSSLHTSHEHAGLRCDAWDWTCGLQELAQQAAQLLAADALIVDHIATAYTE